MSERDLRSDRDGAAPLFEAPALRAQVYERLRDAILAGDLSAGERISPVAVARRFGVSTMPVRDALRLLEQEGLVETAARRWTRVVELTPSLVEEIVPIISLLEQYALKSARSFSPQVIAKMHSANEEFARAIEAGDVVRAIDADAVFHEALVELAGNPSLERALRDARTRIRLLRAEVLRPELAAASVADHEKIIALVSKADGRGAAQLVASNWERGLERFRAKRADSR